MKWQRRKLNYMIISRKFYDAKHRRYVWCRPTGYEVFGGGNPHDVDAWYNEYQDEFGTRYYAK